MPKTELKTLIGKRDNAIKSIQELFEEFETVLAVEPNLVILETIFNLVEAKYRNIKKQQETIADRIVEDGLEETDEMLKSNSEVGGKLKDDYLQLAKVFAAYQTKSRPAISSIDNSNSLETMTSAVTKMAEALQGSSSKTKSSGLERLPVPSWNGSRRSYSTWKKEFQHWMNKYSQDEEEQLQRFRKAMPKNFWWTDQVETCKSIERAWDILDVEFGDKRKLMDELLAAKKEDKKEESVTNLVKWLQEEATLRSRGRHNHESEVTTRKAENRSGDFEVQEPCLLGCQSKHLLAGCPIYQSSTVNQRWNIVKQKQRCRKCLRAHHTKDCNKSDGTTCNQCKKNHHRSLHSEKPLNPDAPSFSTKENEVGINNASISSNQHENDTQIVTGLCPVQKIKIADANGKPMEILAMLDTGSNTSLLSKSAAVKLGLSGPQTHLTMNLAGGAKKSEVSEIIEITVVSPIEEDVRKPLLVHTVNKPCSSAKTVSKASLVKYSHIKPLVEKLHLSGGNIDLLLGTDFADAFIDVHAIPGQAGEPIAKMNCFGWYVLGPLPSSSSRIQSVDIGTVSVVEDLSILLQQDLLGVKPTELCTCSDGELRENKFVKSLSESTTLVDGRVQIKMPWKESGPPRRSNYEIALKRMHSTERSFQRRNCTKAVDEEVQKLVSQSFVKKVPWCEINHTKPEWYLPLQAVFTPEKSTKIRLVFDSSAKGHDDRSLNDYLEKGPNYINELPSVLAAWRWDNVAYSGDVRKMFNQILVHPDDQVFHRFLWRSSPTEEPTVYQWMRLSFGDKPAPDIASNSIKVLARASQSEEPEAATELLEHIYVDDVGGSRPTVQEAEKVTTGIDAILKNGKFEIKTWHSNRKEIDQAQDERFTDLLGHKWDKELDQFTLKKAEITCNLEVLTKRSCLAILAQLWDPIGLISPVTIKFRIDLRDIWSLGYGWDDTLPDEIRKKWVKNVEMMNQLLTLKFDRKLKPSDAIGVPQVHGFSDAGEQAYGAVVFLRWELGNGNFHCVSVIVKAFVAPVKKRSIPRLELLGCLALTRIYETCRKSLAFANVNEAKKFLWVDSTTALSWITTPPKEFRPFVSARVAEIQETVGTNDFHFIRSSSNPADGLTRGIELEQLGEWLSGPRFLKKPEHEWPQFKEDNGKPEVDLAQTRKESKPLKQPKAKSKAQVSSIGELPSSSPNDSAKVGNAASRVNAGSEERNPVLSHLLETCSTYTKVRRTLAYVNRFTRNARNVNRQGGSITVDELRSAEKQLLQWTQSQINVNTIDKQLHVQKDEDGLLRVHGRLENIRTLPNDMRQPILLPRNHPLVYLLLKRMHETNRHCGYQRLMHEARRRFWIIGLRGMAKHLTNRCVICHKLRKKPLGQIMGQIPNLRVAAGFPPFTNTAIDMFGPFQIRLGRKTLKEAQVIIFTCMTTRAVHLELVTDRSSDTFLLAFRRFANLRGHPNTCWSDCGTNFVGAQSYLAEIMQNWDIQKIQNVLSDEFTCEFKWQWNTPRASHQNGVVESLIKSVRQALDATCKNQAFSEEQWRTFLAETTYLINSRPLYPGSEGVWESPPVTPNDILMGTHITPPQPESEEKVNPRNLLRSTENRVNEFWNCWLKYFAPNLLPRNKWFRKREDIKVGDLVLELDNKCRRTQWKMALVTNTYPGEDNHVRKVQIKTANGEYQRPIHKLCLIATKEELNNEDK